MVPNSLSHGCSSYRMKAMLAIALWLVTGALLFWSSFAFYANKLINSVQDSVSHVYVEYNTIQFLMYIEYVMYACAYDDALVIFNSLHVVCSGENQLVYMCNKLSFSPVSLWKKASHNNGLPSEVNYPNPALWVSMQWNWYYVLELFVSDCNWYIMDNNGFKMTKIFEFDHLLLKPLLIHAEVEVYNNAGFLLPWKL